MLLIHYNYGEHVFVQFQEYNDLIICIFMADVRVVFLYLNPA